MGTGIPTPDVIDEHQRIGVFVLRAWRVEAHPPLQDREALHVSEIEETAESWQCAAVGGSPHETEDVA